MVQKSALLEELVHTPMAVVLRLWADHLQV